MDGGKGDDSLSGDVGNDQLTGGIGKDSLEGGDDADRFIFTKVSESAAGANHDSIVDFSRSEGDKIDLEQIDADTTQGGNQAFHLGGGAFNNEAGELIVFNDGGGHRVIQGDVNGDGVADFEIFLDGTPNVKPGDFEL
jgi:Ca2+-binding RTX toxin-like protein